MASTGAFSGGLASNCIVYDLTAQLSGGNGVIVLMRILLSQLGVSGGQDGHEGERQAKPDRETTKYGFQSIPPGNTLHAMTALRGPLQGRHGIIFGIFTTL